MLIYAQSSDGDNTLQRSCESINVVTSGGWVGWVGRSAEQNRPIDTVNSSLTGDAMDSRTRLCCQTLEFELGGITITDIRVPEYRDQIHGMLEVLYQSPRMAIVTAVLKPQPQLIFNYGPRVVVKNCPDPDVERQ